MKKKIHLQVRESEAPFLLTEHLIWRDFFYIMSVNIPNYDKMEGNPLCLQIDWYRDPEKIDKWAEVI
jgi:cryptochrome